MGNFGVFVVALAMAVFAGPGVEGAIFMAAALVVLCMPDSPKPCRCKGGRDNA